VPSGLHSIDEISPCSFFPLDDEEDDEGRECLIIIHGESALRVDRDIPDELDDESFPLKRQTRAVASEAPAANTSCRGFHETAETDSLA